jgi:hypothetical protein
VSSGTLEVTNDSVHAITSKNQSGLSGMSNRYAESDRTCKRFSSCIRSKNSRGKEKAAACSGPFPLMPSYVG